jgi:cell division protein FtsL
MRTGTEHVTKDDLRTFKAYLTFLLISLLNSATGMVWKTNENVQMLPLSNKAAYRRHMMEVS